MRLGEIQKLDIGQADIVTGDDGDELIYLDKTKNGDERYIPIMGDVDEAAHRVHKANFSVIIFSTKVFGKLRS